MLERTITDWKISDKDKMSKLKYMKNLHTSLMEMQSLQELLNASIIKSICIEQGKYYVILNNEYYNIKLNINKCDYQEVPISLLGFGEYEKTETSVLLDMVERYVEEQKHFTFLDIGANVGWYTLNIKKII